MSGSQYEQEEERRVKRPMNSFLLFSNEFRPILQAQNKGLSNAAVSKLLGKRWKEMPKEQKQKYIDGAKKIKEQFNKEHPDFVYSSSSRRPPKRKDPPTPPPVDLPKRRPRIPRPVTIPMTPPSNPAFWPVPVGASKALSGGAPVTALARGAGPSASATPAPPCITPMEGETQEQLQERFVSELLAQAGANAEHIKEILMPRVPTPTPQTIPRTPGEVRPDQPTPTLVKRPPLEPAAALHALRKIPHMQKDSLLSSLLLDVPDTLMVDLASNTPTPHTPLTPHQRVPRRVNTTAALAAAASSTSNGNNTTATNGVPGGAPSRPSGAPSGAPLALGSAPGTNAGSGAFSVPSPSGSRAKAK